MLKIVIYETIWEIFESSKLLVLWNIFFFKMIKSRRMRWAGHLTRIREKRNALGYWWEDQDVGGWTILK
jgi:hypothetical protein